MSDQTVDASNFSEYMQKIPSHDLLRLIFEQIATLTEMAHDGNKWRIYAVVNGDTRGVVVDRTENRLRDYLDELIRRAVGE